MLASIRGGVVNWLKHNWEGERKGREGQERNKEGGSNQKLQKLQKGEILDTLLLPPLTSNGADAVRLQNSTVGTDTVLLRRRRLHFKDNLLIRRVLQMKRRGHNLFKRA